MPQDKIKKNINSIRDLTASCGPAISQGMQTLGYLSAEYSYVASAVCALLSIWGNFANKKASDFMQQFRENQDKIVGKIVSSDKFISIFLELFDRNIKESNEEKRQLLKNYILNLACGIKPNFNEHTKLINVLNNITLEEIEILKLWDEDEIIEDQKDKLLTGLSIRDIENLIRKSPHNYNIQTGREHLDKNSQILLSLGNKGLLYVLSRDNWGSTEEVKAHKDITEFGNTFLKFIKI